MVAKGFSFQVEKGIGTITFDLPGEKVNKLTSDVLRALNMTLEEIANKSLDALVIRSGKPQIFIAGADINEIKDIVDPEEGQKAAEFGQEILNKLDALPYPTLAVIEGACLGGGCELALACDYRVATDTPKVSIGLPEVNLGILPGFGGTQRLPKLVGIQAALQLILTGKPVDAQKALRIKLVDEVYPQAFLEAKLKTFIAAMLTPKGKQALKNRRKKSTVTRLLEDNPLGRAIIYRKAKADLLSKTHGHYPAPLLALDAVCYGYAKSLKKGLKKEAQLFSQLVATTTSKNLVELFFINESLKKYTGIASDVAPKAIQSAGVLGAGLMGGGIAWLFSYRSIPVRLKDLTWAAIAKGYEAAHAMYAPLVKSRRLSPREADLDILNITGTLDYQGFKKADVVVEAIVEDIAVKKKVFQHLETVVRPDTIIASNTSSLSITEMATVLTRPERFVGMHFFSPVNRMPLVEVIRGEHTSDETVASIVKLSQTLKKTPIVVKNCPGFLVNRILIPYVVEAVYCLQDGADIETVDRALVKFGMPLGPLALADEVGLDVGYKVAKILEEGYGERMKIAPAFEKIYADKTLRGKKSGEGFYLHHGQKQPNPKVAALVKTESKKTVSLAHQDLVDRMILMMVNEAALCIEEKVVETPQLLDIAMIMGTGFPAFRGGLCRYADQRGIGTIVKRLQDLSQHDARFKPAPLLVEFAEKNKTFYS